MNAKILKVVISYNVVIENDSSFKTIVIGKKNSYKINNKIENCFEIELILGELRYSTDVDFNLSNILKNNGYNFYSVANIAHHGKFIKENKLKIGFMYIDIILRDPTSHCY